MIGDRKKQINDLHEIDENQLDCYSQLKRIESSSTGVLTEFRVLSTSFKRRSEEYCYQKATASHSSAQQVEEDKWSHGGHPSDDLNINPEDQQLQKVH